MSLFRIDKQYYNRVNPYRPTLSELFYDSILYIFKWQDYKYNREDVKCELLNIIIQHARIQIKNIYRR